jgi:cytochrome c556
MRRRRYDDLVGGVTATLLAAVLMFSIATAQQGNTGTPPKSLVPVAASTMTAKPDAYYGEYVSLTATVERILSTLAFSVDQDKTKSTGKEILVFAPRLNEPVDANTYVTVIGEVVRFEPDVIADKAKSYTLDLPPDDAARYRGGPAILATSVINASGLDVARRLPPPLTAEEEAYAKIMKEVGPSNAALRKAIEGSDAKLAAEHAGVLKNAFTRTESFWKTKGKTDAVKWSQDARKLAEAIDLAAAAGEWDEVKTSVTKLGQSCQTCHTAYRERFDDGSFRIKLGG